MFVEYKFNMDDGKTLNYRVEFDRQREHILDASAYPAWTALEFHQCPNCPLKTSEHSHCPVAIDAQEIVMGFNEVLSCRVADIQVTTPDREYFKRTDGQQRLPNVCEYARHGLFSSPFCFAR
jgi:hypothetical protein